MATVYGALDRKHGRPVALKVLRPELSVALGAERFLREITLAARLQHPHILPVHDSGVVEAGPGRPPVHWFTMPLVAGESLRERLQRERQLPVDEAVRIAHEIARALDHAHRHGIIHRDIKPENILITAEGDTLVADFGVGRAVGGTEAGDRLTEGGVVVGTPAYMSPEQAAGERELDGRTDVYSLGIVLYEMLAGEPPFTGPVPQAVVARRLTETPRPLRPLREAVSAELDAVVQRALARVPADRYTASGLAESLDRLRRAPAGGVGVAPGDTLEIRPRRARAAPLVAAGLLLAAGAGWLLLSPRGPPRELDPALVAVAPFDVLDPGLGLWREGLVDLVSRNLDGAGPIRSVSPTLVVRRWEGRADPVAAGALGRATGAGLAVYGSLLRNGADSVRLRATLLDVGRGSALEEWDLAEHGERMDRLVDSLTYRVLQGIGRTRPVGAVRSAWLGATGLPALKAFLQAEQFMRRSEFDSALAHYERAIALDGNFPLALRRASMAVGWAATGFDSLSIGYALRAGALNHGLPPRDSLALVADSLLASLLEADRLAVHADSAWGSRLRRLFATLQQATGRYGNDPELWFMLGEAGTHLGPYAGWPARRTRDAFERSIALDSAFAPAYIHPIEIAAAGGAGEARPLLARYLALDPHDRFAEGLRLVAALLDSGSARRPVELAEGVSEAGVFAAITVLSRLPDSAEAVVDLARFLASAPRTHARDPVRALGRALMSRGHLREGLRVIGSALAATADEARLLGAVPPDSLAAEFRRRLGGTDPVALAAALPWWASRGDTAAVQQAGARAESLAASATGEIERARVRYLAAAAQAYLSLARGDTAAALDRLAGLPSDDCPRCYLEHLVRAQLLVERHRDEEAWALLQSDLPSAALAPFAGDVLWALLRARVAERLGERAVALRNYAWVAGMWRAPDPELLPYRDEARQGLARLTAERTP